ncbi:MAG TPA: hypothetical protein VFZ67_03540 [Nitrososphaera sp.]
MGCRTHNSRISGGTMDIFYDKMLIILSEQENINDILISGNGSQQNTSSAT